jgi:hypothetical protein
LVLALIVGGTVVGIRALRNAEAQRTAEVARLQELEKVVEEVAAREPVVVVREYYTSTLVTATAPITEPVATPTPEIEAVPTVIATPMLSPTLSTTPITETRVYTYTPGGLNYTWPEPESVDWFEDGWHRIRQATNGDLLPWTFQVRITADMPLDDVAQWDSATKLLLTNPTTVTMKIRVEIRRDFEAPQAYDQAQPGALGLGWFITGARTTVVVNGADPVELVGLGVKQMNFPREWAGIWEINLELAPGAQVTLNQGARRTSVDNWPLPATPAP